MILTKSSSELSVISGCSHSHSPCHSSDTNKEQGSTQLAQHGVASASLSYLDLANFGQMMI